MKGELKNSECLVRKKEKKGRLRIGKKVKRQKIYINKKKILGEEDIKI